MLSSYLTKKLNSMFDSKYSVSFSDNNNFNKFMIELNESYIVKILPCIDIIEEDVLIETISNTKIAIYTNDESDIMLMKLLSPSMSKFTSEIKTNKN